MQSEDDQSVDKETRAYTGQTRRLSSLRIIDNRTGTEPSCPKCGGSMEQGWMPELVQNGALLPLWLRGRPRKRWLGGYSVSDTRRHHIVTLRCTGCGYLESYAP